MHQGVGPVVRHPGFLSHCDGRINDDGARYVPGGQCVCSPAVRITLDSVEINGVVGSCDPIPERQRRDPSSPIGIPSFIQPGRAHRRAPRGFAGCGSNTPW